MVLNTAITFVFVFSYAIRGQSDGFPVSHLNTVQNLQDGVLTSSTRPDYLYSRWISSSSIPLTSDNHQQISSPDTSSNDRDLVSRPTERQPSMPFDGMRRISSPSDYKPNVSPTASHAIMSPNTRRRGSGIYDSPMILFDKHGDMHTNYYPHPRATYRGIKTDQKKVIPMRRWGSADILPKWSAVTK